MSDDEKNPFKKGMKNEDWPKEVMKLPDAGRKNRGVGGEGNRIFHPTHR